MKVEFRNVMNKEYKSLTCLKIDDQTFHLTDKELVNLLISFYSARSDIFEQCALKADSAQTARLKRRIRNVITGV